ncbi:MAG: hypothetical protein S0880_10245, partial [Actinomycetota bacterium]|nr:hypothetical protein [Actinomycetota bacterium]
SAGGSADLGGAGAAEGTAVGGEGGVGDAALGGAGSAAGVVGVAASTVSAPLEVDGDASGVVGLAAAAAAAELGPAASGSGVAGDVSSGASAVLGGTATGSGVAGDVATSAAADLGGAGAAEGTVGVAGSASAVLGGTATGSGDGATPVTGTGAAALGGVASASGRVAAGDPVVAIYDAADGPIGSSSVTGWNAYAGSSGAAPTLTLNGGAPALVAAATPAGTPAVQFAASDEGLLSGDIADRQQPWTAAFVARVTTDGFCFGFRASNVDYIRRQASLNRWLVSSGFPDGFNQVVPDSAPDDWHVWVIVADGTSSVVSIDGSETAVELQNPVTHLTFGSFRPSGQSSPMHWADLEVAEFRVLAGAEDASARAALVAELTAKHLTAPTPETPTVEGNSAGWDALVSILESSRAEAWQSARDEALEPLACPNDGQPLRRAADGGLFCEFDGWRPDGGSAYRAGRAGGAPGEAGDRDWGGLASIQADIASSSRIAGRRVGEVSCPLCGEPLVDGQDGERRCLYDGWPDADV